MWPRLADEGAPRVRRLRAMLRLHRRTALAAVLAAGIVLMVIHWY